MTSKRRKISMSAWLSGAFTTSLLSLSLSPHAYGLDLPNCKPGEYLWLMTAGNPAGTLMPRADMRVSTVTFQDWTDGTTILRTAQFENIPRGVLGEAKTFERYSGGGDLGSFSKSWPASVDGVERDALEALPPRNPAPSSSGGEYPSNFASSNLIDGASGQTLAQVVSSPTFDGRLTYVAPSEARIDFVTLALCSRALPQKTAPSSTQASTAPSATAPQTPAALSEAQIAARIAELQAANQTETTSQKDTMAEVRARAEAARIAAEEEAEALRKAEAERLEAERLETERQDAERLEKEQLDAERLDAERREQERLAKIEQEKEPASTTPPSATQSSPKIKTKKATRENLLLGGTVKTQTKRDMLTSAALAGSAVLNLAVQGLASLFRGSGVPTPAPNPVPTQANAGQISRKRDEDQTDTNITDMPDDVPSLEDVEKFKASEAAPISAPIAASSNPISSVNVPEPPTAELDGNKDISVIIPGSTTSTGPIETTNAAILTAYDAVGRVGYPHAVRAARDAKGLGFGSAILIAPDKVLTNHHVWSLIKNKSGIGIEFNAREGEQISEFITLKSMNAEILEGLDAVVLTLSRRLPRTPIWPCDMDYTAPDIEGREIIAIGHPIKPEGESWLLKQAILEAFGEDPLWNVKRHSRGPLTLHTEDDDGNILFEVPVNAEINPAKRTAALCHRATTVGGFSGGAIICADTGEFLGLHFGGQYLDGEDINYAVPGRALLKGLAAIEPDKPTAPSALQHAPHNTAAPAPTLTPQAAMPPPEPSEIVDVPNGDTDADDSETGDLFDFAQVEEDTFSTSMETKNADDTKKNDSKAPKSETFTEYLIEKAPPSTNVVPSPEGEDDLTLIEGIGPKTAKALQDYGIRSFKTLSQGSPYDLLPVLEAAGLPRRDPTTWPAQAALAASGDWDRLKDWQDKLHGGREVS